jgi:diguanylate cyclase (GGDEF)-like protein
VLRILIAAAHDTAAADAERALRETAIRADIVTAIGTDSVIARIAGYTPDCVLAAVSDDDEATSCTADFARFISGPRAVPLVFLGRVSAQAASSVANETGATATVVSPGAPPSHLKRAIRDILRAGSAEREAFSAIERIAQQSLTDSVTGLPNRSLFVDRLQQTISFARRERWEVALVVVDLPSLQLLNAEFGQATGDHMLRELSARLRTLARESDTVARIGGDRFAVLMPTGASLPGAVIAAERVIDALSRPVAMQDAHRRPDVAVGIAIYPEHGEDVEVLLRNAVVAAEEAVRDDKPFAVYAESIATSGVTSQRRQISLTADLQYAIAGGQLLVHYQPIVDFASTELSGVEALVRWQHPTHGLLQPETFVPIAEQTGRIDSLTGWVVDRVLRQCREWSDDGLDIPVSINISPMSLHNLSLADRIGASLETWGIPSSKLILEITESAIISDAARATETVERLHRMGIRVSIDDFGTGYTSLAYIRRLPVSGLKIDKSFVRNMDDFPDDAVIVRSIIDLGHNLGLRVVAEGIEKRVTWDMLAALRCNAAQGYFISPPLDADGMSAWAKSRTWRDRVVPLHPGRSVRGPIER